MKRIMKKILIFRSNTVSDFHISLLIFLILKTNFFCLALISYALLWMSTAAFFL